MSYHLDTLIPATVEPVTLRQVYDQLRFFDDPPHNQDDMLERFITTARMDAESYTNRAFVEQTLRLTGDSFYASNGCCVAIPLLRHPIISIESVSYYDSVNELQTVADENYYLTADGYLRFVNGFSYPSAYHRSDAIRIDYVAGYALLASPPENIPQPIKQAILIGVELLWAPLTPEERTAMSDARTALLWPYRINMGV